MYEYKVESVNVKSAEALMNKLAKECWRVFSIVPDLFKGFGLVVTFERETK